MINLYYFKLKITLSLLGNLGIKLLKLLMYYLNTNDKC